MKNKSITTTNASRTENAGEKGEVSLLDLPDLGLECILDRLSPAGLTSMAGVCTSLREMSTSDHLWERHMKQKWGNFLGDAAYKEWQLHVASTKRQRQTQTLLDCSNKKGYLGVFTSIWPLSIMGRTRRELRSCLPVDSIMAWYLSIESGKFCFPAQVYNRENGHFGFLLSCYDAKISYDSSTDTFRARFSAHGRPMVEENIGWNRLRAPAVDTPAHDLHVSDCLNDLQPGDHIEIQWRKSKEFPYGWWYGVVGHLESCDGNKLYCQCHHSDTVTLEFKQYAPGSRWREVVINRKDHREVGNEADGFYAGIRKLNQEDEISMWKGLWPTKPLE